MTAAPATLQPRQRRRREPDEKLFVTDEELIEILGVPVKDGRRILGFLDSKRTTGFPQKNPLFSGRRYLPAVKMWLDRNAGLTIAAPPLSPERANG